jgi:virginiamycin B lyase
MRRHTLTRTLLALAVAAAVPACGTATAYLSTGSTAVYSPLPLGLALGGVASGPDGNVWFPYGVGAPKPRSGIGAIAPDTGRVVTSAPMPAALALGTNGGGSSNIITGPDGNLWFLQQFGTNRSEQAIVRLTTTGTFTAFPFPAGTKIGGGFGGPSLIAGPDGNLWVTAGSALMRVTTSGEMTSFALPAGLSGASSVASGSDGNIWFSAVQWPASVVGRMTTEGASPQIFTLPMGPLVSSEVALGPWPDGTMWQLIGTYDTDGNPNGGLVTSISNAGDVRTIVTLPNYAPCQVSLCNLVQGADGNAWFGDGSALDRVSPSGNLTRFPVVTAPGGGSVTNVIVGPDKNFWFTINSNVGRMAAVGGNPIPAPAKSVINGLDFNPIRRGASVGVTFVPGSHAAGRSTLTLSRGNRSVRIWRGTVKAGAMRSVTIIVPRGFPTGNATLTLNPPKVAGRAKTSLIVK